ncbi:glycosyltransferase family 2 protein [Novosphingobium piscinae]|uniref:Glycosyltransferase family 2 protein n=2 Tax=Novosphingobium piscinae TaxID=1507448 RepID=A0A7X1FXX3_9SPHN|nr:glycosyltransferase family 2 protein [Novosphingobium piscinae]
MWLAVRVHWDGFWRNPRQWLAGLWWYVQGKRVRGRSRIEPLIGASSRAYELLLARESVDPLPADAGPPICAIIDTMLGCEQLAATLQSLESAGFAARVAIGTKPAAQDDASLVWLRHPVELPGYLAAAGIAWICPVRCGDRFAPGTGLHYAAAAALGRAEVVYSDDDLIGSDGLRSDPYFKPRWNSELFRHHDYVGGSAAWRWEPVADEFAGGLDRALVAAVERAEGRVHHIPQVLHHRRARPKPRPLSRTTPSVQPQRVSIIVPTRDQPDLLRTCLAGVDQVAWDDVELVIIDNGSTEPATLALLDRYSAKGAKVLRDDGPFNFSRLNNLATQAATGSMLCLLNNDVEMLGDDWLAWLVAAAQRDDVGAAGALLLYPDRTIQHAGVVLGVGGGAAHAHRGLDPTAEGYFRRHQYPQFVSAVTGACLVVARERFMAVGGLDEDAFPVAFNDVDLCLKLNARGWRSFYEPRACLIHHESKSRGLDRDRVNRMRFAGELAALKHRWRTAETIDPAHHHRLSRYSDQFVLAV